MNVLIKPIAARLAAAFTMIITLSSPVLAEVPAAVNDLIVAQLKSGRPDLEYSVVGKSAIAGFYEVQVQNGPLLYVSADGNHFFDGSLYLIKSGQFVNIRDMQMAGERRQLFASRGTEDMIIFKPAGATKAIMNVFTDIDCGYCRKLHQEVAELNALGIEVRYLAYPRAGIPSASYDKIATAWCAQDQQQTLTKAKRGESVATAVCADNPVAEHYALGQRIGVAGTPAIVLMDGTLIPGYQPAASFAQILGLTEPSS
ncbi:MAG: protein-disulfide isomerase [Porticoccaceae bacterium]|jgi:thiol:disulfide interchange protein DsbC|nr:protein-disulfide isomerase [Porticoccaceae bacterium]MDG2117238.1 DsbC family protein [Porticoccaceae bacterium]